jgi:glutathione S-transferase
MDLVLHKFRPLYGMPSASPFGVKLECYLRMASIPHTTRLIGGRPRSATGKGPYIERDGEFIADSGLIIAQLEKERGHPVDGRLTLAQRGESLAFQRMMEEHLYWVAVYARWIDPERRSEIVGYIHALLRLPRPVATVVEMIARRTMRQSLHRQGLGRHPPETIWAMGAADIQALAHWLGQKQYCFGDTPTVVDACLYAFVGCLIGTPWEFPLTEVTRRHGNLVAHAGRMHTRYFPELKPLPGL